MEIGIKGKVETVVDGSNTAKFVGSGSLDVFATPCMVGLMEQAAQMSVAPYLGEGEGTVGTKLEISHDAATPLGNEGLGRERAYRRSTAADWFSRSRHLTNAARSAQAATSAL